MKLRALLDLPGSRLELVTGRDELDRAVRWVVTTDLLEPGRYLRGGELVLTGLMWRSEPADSETFVRALAAAGASALAGGLARGALPDDLVAACRAHRLPLFAVPEDVAFATITEEVVRHLSGARAADLTAVLDRHRRLIAGTAGMAGAAGAAGAGGVGAVLELVSRDLGMRCWVLTPTGRVVAGPGPVPGGAELARAFLTARRLPRPHAGVSIFPVAARAVPRVADWFLACEGDVDDWPAERRALATELASIVALERARLDDRLSVEGRLAQELVRLVAGAAGAEEIAPRLELSGLDAASRFVAVAASGGGVLRENELRAVLGEVLGEVPPVPRPVLGLLDEEAVALVQVEGAGHGVADGIQRALDALAPGFADGGGLAVGVSDVVPAGELRGALEEARYARRLAAGRASPVCVVRHDELATHVLLLASVPDDVRHMFRVRLLDPLRTYDDEHKADLVRTLETFLQNSGSWTRCAQQLHLHVNSVRYRIQRIEDLTGRDLSRLEDRVDFFLALRLG
ncbi:PucR family transcriptional regulator [Actinomadura terrae]|uniref:PucR family transcriptional regulator n=1 Tax=Actinomadura terrae TaxID=604353 RepID=UPI001FA7A943|nr:PucR family transcriptional regulator [Actinomadura terrae]